MPICFIEDPHDWHEAEALVVGTYKSSLIAARVGIESDAGLRLRIDIPGDEDCICFQDVRLVGSIAFIGYGSRLFVLDLNSRQYVLHRMCGYFNHLYSSNDFDDTDENFPVLASSASHLLAFDRAGELIWKSDDLGIDGVIVHQVSGGIVHGDGEWDPPGGWEPFALSLATGIRQK